MTARSGQEPLPYTVPAFRIVSRSALIAAGASTTVNPTLGTAFVTGECAPVEIAEPRACRTAAARVHLHLAVPVEQS